MRSGGKDAYNKYLFKLTARRSAAEEAWVAVVVAAVGAVRGATGAVWPRNWCRMASVRKCKKEEKKGLVKAWHE